MATGFCLTWGATPIRTKPRGGLGGRSMISMSLALFLIPIKNGSIMSLIMVVRTALYYLDDVVSLSVDV